MLTYAIHKFPKKYMNCEIVIVQKFTSEINVNDLILLLRQQKITFFYDNIIIFKYLNINNLNPELYSKMMRKIVVTCQKCPWQLGGISFIFVSIYHELSRNRNKNYSM